MYSVMPDPLVDRSIDRSVGPSVRRSTFSLSFALSPVFLIDSQHYLLSCVVVSNAHYNRTDISITPVQYSVSSDYLL